jgi:transcription initiation factor IIE alpha subunit
MRVKREQVLDFVISHGFSAFTTTDIAEALQVKEYACRAAISWLVLGQYIEIHGWHADREHVRLYLWTGKTGDIPTVRRDRDEREYAQGCEKFSSAGNALQDIFAQIRRNR